MENNDFDIFELIKVLFKQKVKFLAFFLVFFGLAFLYLQSSPTKYRVNFIVSSSVLNQSEIELKVNQLVYLLENKAYNELSNVLDTELELVKKIEYIEVKAVKKSTDLVDVLFSSSSNELSENFLTKLKAYFDADPNFSQKETLVKKQLEYSLEKYNEELDSVKTIENFSGVFIQNAAQELNVIIDKRNKAEKELAFYHLLQVYDGAKVISLESSLLINLISALMFAFAFAFALVLGLHFVTVMHKKTKD